MSDLTALNTVKLVAERVAARFEEAAKTTKERIDAQAHRRAAQVMKVFAEELTTAMRNPRESPRDGPQ